MCWLEAGGCSVSAAPGRTVIKPSIQRIQSFVSSHFSNNTHTCLPPIGITPEVKMAGRQQQQSNSRKNKRHWLPSHVWIQHLSTIPLPSGNAPSLPTKPHRTGHNQAMAYIPTGREPALTGLWYILALPPFELCVPSNTFYGPLWRLKQKGTQ